MQIAGRKAPQNVFAFIEGGVPTARYEYAVLAASTQHDPRARTALAPSLAGLLSSLKVTVEQLTDAERLCTILTRAFAKFMLATAAPPALQTPQIATG